MSALQSHMRAGTATFTMAGGSAAAVGGGLRQVTATQIAAPGSLGTTARPAQLIQQQQQQSTMIRAQPATTGLIVSHQSPQQQQLQQPRQQTLTLQRPQQVGLVAASRPGSIRQQVVVTGSPLSQAVIGSPGATTTLVRAVPQQQQQQQLILTSAGSASPAGLAIGSPRLPVQRTTQVHAFCQLYWYHTGTSNQGLKGFPSLFGKKNRLRPVSVKICSWSVVTL